MRTEERYIHELINYLNGEEYDTVLLEAVEKKVGVHPALIDDHRRTVMAYIGTRVWKHDCPTLPLHLQKVISEVNLDEYHKHVRPKFPMPKFQVTIEGDD